MQNVGEGGGGMFIIGNVWVVNEARCFQQQCLWGRKETSLARSYTKRNLKLKQRRMSIYSEAFALFIWLNAIKFVYSG